MLIIKNSASNEQSRSRYREEELHNNKQGQYSTSLRFPSKSNKSIIEGTGQRRIRSSIQGKIKERLGPLASNKENSKEKHKTTITIDKLNSNPKITRSSSNCKIVLMF